MKGDLRQTMPETAKWVDREREKYGAAFVHECIRKAMKGEPGYFYAIEGGHVLGTPFPFTNIRHHYQGIAIVTGCTFAGFIAQPDEQPESQIEAKK